MKEKSNSFRGKITKEAQRSAQKDSGYLSLPKGIKMYNVEAETRKVKLDILPYTVSDVNHPCKNLSDGTAVAGSLWYRRPIKVHRSVGQGNARVICPTSVGKKCPICEYQKKLFNEGRPKEETVPLYPQNRSLYVVIPDGEDDIYVWDMANKMFQDMLMEELQDNPENEVFPDLEEGKTLEIRLKWKSFGDKGKPFPEATNVTFLDRDPYKESILDEVPDLDKLFVVKTYDEIKNLFFELDDEPDAGELKEEADEPKTERRERREKKVEKEEEETPKRTRKEVKEEEPEEEEKPARKRKEVEKEEEEPSARKRKDPVEEKSGGECPHDHVFGKDFEKFDICDKCDKWDACYDANKKLKKG